MPGVLPPGLARGVVLPYRDALKSPERDIVLIVEFDAESTAGVVASYRYASEAITLAPDDEAGNSKVEGRLRNDWMIGVRVPQDAFGAFGGALGYAFGEIALKNADYALDSLARRRVDGRRVRIRAAQARRNARGEKTWRLDESGVLMEARGDGWSWSDDDLILRIVDRTEQLREPIQTAEYAGTGGSEGDEQLEGKRRGMAFGRLPNLEPTLVDKGRLIYQVSSLPGGDINAVMVSANPIDVRAREADTNPAARTASAGDASPVINRRIRADGGYAKLASFVPPPGGYSLSTDQGLWFRLGSQPQGRVTVDVDGAELSRRIVRRTAGAAATVTETTRAHGLTLRPGELILHILTLRGWGEDEIDVGSLRRVDRQLPHTIGYHLPAGEQANYDAVLEDIGQGCGLIVGTTRQGLYGAWLYTGPDDGAVAEYDTRHLTSFRRLDLPYFVPPKGIKVGWGRNHTVMNEDEVAPAVRDRMGWLEDEYRYYTLEDAARAKAHPNAAMPEKQTHFAYETGARAYAGNFMAATDPAFGLYEARLPFVTELDRLDTIRITHPRFAPDGGSRLLAVVGLDETASGGLGEAVLVLHG